MQIRLIIVSNENGSREHVVFTEDFDSPAEDWCEPDQSIDYDRVINADLPMSFPMETSLLRDM